MPTVCESACPQAVLGALCGASEYDELPVRHNEDQLNLGLSSQVTLSMLQLHVFQDMRPGACSAQLFGPLRWTFNAESGHIQKEPGVRVV